MSKEVNSEPEDFFPLSTSWTRSDYNLTNNNSLQSHYVPDPAAVAVGISAIVFAIIGVAGNGLTILALCREKHLRRKTTTWFVLNLCACDLLYCAIRLPLAASRHLTGAGVGVSSCALSGVLSYTGVYASRVGLVIVTLNRYIFIVHHSWYKRLYGRWSVIGQIGLSWVIPLTMTILPGLESWGTFGWDVKRPICRFLPHNGKSPEVIFGLVFTVIPIIVIVFCYSHIFIFVKRQQRNLSDVASSRRKLKRSDWQLAKMFLILFLAFLASALPPVVIGIVNGGLKGDPTLISIALILFWTQFWSNFIVYATMNKSYRAAYTNLLCFCYKPTPVISSTSGTEFNSRRSVR